MRRLSMISKRESHLVEFALKKLDVVVIMVKNFVNNSSSLVNQV